MSIQEDAGKRYDNLYESRDYEPMERKEYARWVKNQPKHLLSILVAMYDKKNYAHTIWKMLRPSYEQPFNNKIEEN